MIIRQRTRLYCSWQRQWAFFVLFFFTFTDSMQHLPLLILIDRKHFMTSFSFKKIFVYHVYKLVRVKIVRLAWDVSSECFLTQSAQGDQFYYISGIKTIYLKLTYLIEFKRFVKNYFHKIPSINRQPSTVQLNQEILISVTSNSLSVHSYLIECSLNSQLQICLIFNCESKLWAWLDFIARTPQTNPHLAQYSKCPNNKRASKYETQFLRLTLSASTLSTLTETEFCYIAVLLVVFVYCSMTFNFNSTLNSHEVSKSFSLLHQFTVEMIHARKIVMFWQRTKKGKFHFPMVGNYGKYKSIRCKCR